MRDRRRINRHLAGLVSAAALMLGAASPAFAEEIIVGVASAQTGGLAPFDQPSLAGLKIAVDEINAKGGFGGKYPVRLIVKDTRSDMGATATITQELVDAGAKILITPCDADPSIAAGQVTQPLGIPTLTFCGTAPILTGAVGDVMFGTYPGDNLQATVLANYAYDQGLRKVYLLKSPDSTYTMRLPEYFGEVFTRKGGAVVGEGSFSMNQSDFSAEVTKIKNLADKPDLIMTAGYEPDFPAFVQQLRAAGVSTPVFGADAIGTGTILGLGKLVDGTVYTAAGYATPGSKLAAFETKFKDVTGHAPESAYEANGYDIGLILDTAVTKADSVDPKAIRNALAGIEKLEGVTGEITYAGTDRMPLRSVALVKYQDGARVFIGTQVPAAAEVPAP